MFWKVFFDRLNNVNSYLYNDVGLRGKAVINMGAIPKVKFVREQRIFAKGSRGPTKKRSTTLLRSLDLYLSSSPVQNIPPLSTVLGLYGINVQKFCDDYNKFIKQFLYEHIPIKLRLFVTKDLNFSFEVHNIRQTVLLQALDTRAIGTAPSFLTSRSLSFGFIRAFYQLSDSSEVEHRDFTLLDFWMLLFFLFFFGFKYEHNHIHSIFLCESMLRIFYATLRTFQHKGLYRFRLYKI